MHDTTITPETERKIRQFCKTISVAYDLDDEIQEELRGHIEDKLLGYLSGEEALTEDDAFVLVREHFGSPENVRELLEEAHGRTTRGAFARRLGAVLVATAAVEILVSLRLYAASFMLYIDRLFFPIARDFAGNTSFPFSPLSFFTRWFGLITIALVLWYILVRWQKGIRGDRPPWYQRLKPSLFVGLFAVAILLQRVDPLIRSMDHAEKELFEARRPLLVSHAIKPDIDVFSGGFVTGRFLGFGALVLGIYLALTRLRIMEQRTGMLGLREELA